MPTLNTHTHTHPFNGPLSGTTQVCISLQTDNHASTPPLSFLQAGCPSCHPTNSVKALKAPKKHKKTTQQNNANAALANGLFEMNLILCSFLRPPKKQLMGINSTVISVFSHSTSTT